MKFRERIQRHTIGLLAVAASGLVPAVSLASAFGTLSNFDVVNDTSEPCHGFEIELEDLEVGDIAYTFGGNYIRFGTPEVLDVTDDPAHPRTLVRYRRWNGSFWEATPIAPPGVRPRGHDCYSSGPIGNYRDSGCEHFGISLRRQPTRTTYRWLVAADPNDPSSAFLPVPQAVELPVPVWNVAANPGGGNDVRAEVEPIEEEVHAQYGEPQWMKVYKVESEVDLQPEDLVRLLLGADDAIVPDETEIETEWKLIQSKPGDAEGDDEDAEVAEDRIGEDKRSVVRRYEFYRYTGPRDAENNEAEPCIEDDQPVPEEDPVDGCADLGAFVGAQNVAVDLDGDVVEATPTATATAALEATPTPGGGLCSGDCSGDRMVTVDELITLVNILLGTASVDACAHGLGADAPVDVTLLVEAIDHVLIGCRN